MCWIFAQVPGFIQKEGSIFSGFALLVEQHLVCAWTMLLLLYIVTLSIDSPVSELV